MKNQHKKGFIVPVLLAIIAVLIVGGGIYVFSQRDVQVEETAKADTEVQQAEQVQEQTNTASSVSSITPTITKIVLASCSGGSSCPIKAKAKVSIFGSNFNKNAHIQIDDGYITYIINKDPNTSGTSSSLSFFVHEDINIGKHTLQVVNPVVDEFGNPNIPGFENFATGSNISNTISFDI